MPYEQNIPAPSFDWSAFLRAQEMKNQNRQQMNQDIAGIGQGLGQGLGAIGQIIQAKRKQKLLNDISNLMSTQGNVIQGPTDMQTGRGYLPPGNDPTRVPAGETVNNTAQIQGKLTQYDPELGVKYALGMQKDKDTDLYRQQMLDLRKDQIDANRNQKIQAGEAKQTARQDRLEQNARQLANSIKGDRSLLRTEEQRDASSFVYNTINQIKQEGRLPSETEYVDIIAQLYKARTGAVPTEQVMRDMKSSVASGDISKALRYISGNLAAPTSQAIIDNIQKFAASSGVMADKLHEGYMKSRLVKPSGLDDERWESIAKQTRGLSFQEMTGYAPQSGSNGGQKRGISGRSFNSIEEAEAANLPKGTKIMVNGRRATVQ